MAIGNINADCRTAKFQPKKKTRAGPHSGSIFSIILRLLNLVLSACLKNLKRKRERV